MFLEKIQFEFLRVMPTLWLVIVRKQQSVSDNILDSQIMVVDILSSRMRPFVV